MAVTIVKALKLAKLPKAPKSKLPKAPKVAKPPKSPKGMSDGGGFAQWYSEHGEEYNAKRRAKYKADAEYREKIKKQARDAKKERTASRHGAIPRLWKNQTLLVYRIGHVASNVGTTVAVLRTLEAEGVIPKSIFGGAQRVYTQNQQDLIFDLIEAIAAASAMPSAVAGIKNNKKLYIKAHWLDGL